VFWFSREIDFNSLFYFFLYKGCHEVSYVCRSVMAQPVMDSWRPGMVFEILIDSSDLPLLFRTCSSDRFPFPGFGRLRVLLICLSNTVQISLCRHTCRTDRAVWRPA
jgi:hypothetical protein